MTVDRYGRKVPKHAHGTANLGVRTSSTQKIVDAVMELYDRIVDPALSVRRVTIAANRLVDEAQAQGAQTFEQLDLFTDYAAREKEKEAEAARLARERKLQEAMIAVKKNMAKMPS